MFLEWEIRTDPSFKYQDILTLSHIILVLWASMLLEYLRVNLKVEKMNPCLI